LAVSWITTSVLAGVATFGAANLAWIAELADPRNDGRQGPRLAAAASERIGLGLGAHERARRSAARATLPGFPLKPRKTPNPEHLPRAGAGGEP